MFEPDTVRDGIEFDYVEELLSNPNNIELQIKRRQPAGSATGEKHPNTSNKLPSDNSISQTEEKSTLSEEKVSSKIRESRKMPNENSANRIDNGRKIEYDVKKVDRKPPQLHQFTKQDEAVLRKRVMERNSSGKGLFPIDFAYTANHFVVYQNFGEDNYKKISTLDIDINKDIIAYIEKEIKNGRIYRTSPELRSDIVRFRSEHRRSSSNYDTATNARSNGRTGGLHRSQSTGNNEQSFGTSSDNISKVKHSRKENSDYSLSSGDKASLNDELRQLAVYDDLDIREDTHDTPPIPDTPPREKKAIISL